VYLGQQPNKATPKTLLDQLNYLAPLNTAQAQLKRQGALAQLKQICSQVLNQGIQLQVFGSELLKITQAHSDIDVLCPIPHLMQPEHFFNELQTALAQVAQGVHLVNDARVPALKFELQGVNFDLLAVQTPLFPSPLHRVKPEDFTQFDELSWQSVVGYLEGQQIRSIGEQTVGTTLFKDLLRVIRLWANRKQLTGNAFGFFGNISWAILAAWSCKQYPKQANPTLEDLLKHFFSLLAQHDWTKPIGLQQGEPRYAVRKHRDWMPVVSAFHPYKNTTRNLTQSTAKVIRQVIQETHKLLQNNTVDWQTFFDEVDVKNTHQQRLIMELQASDKPNLELAQGTLTGSLLGIILGLEQQVGAEVRPSTKLQTSEDGLQLKLTLGLNLPANTSTKDLSEFVGESDHPHNTTLKVYVEGV
jgi:poly(A) polymerase Pap1